MDLYPSNLGADARKDVDMRSILCSFLAGSISVAQARIQENVEEQVSFVRRYWLCSRSGIEDFPSEGGTLMLERTFKGFRGEFHRY